MYKVFIENRAVIFTQKSNSDHLKDFKGEEKRTYKKWLIPFVRSCKEGEEITVFCDNLEAEMAVFFKKHRSVFAAGGIVERNGQLLFIKRNGLWDIPKGKIEEGESIEEAAIREVEEECGIRNVAIVNRLAETVHTYEMKGERYLKKTYWYAMFYEGNDLLVPQVEEGISEVKWFNSNELEVVMENTFPSIKELVLLYLKQPKR